MPVLSLRPLRNFYRIVRNYFDITDLIREDYFCPDVEKLPLMDFYAAVKKICITRDPKDRIVSWHFQQIRKGRKKSRKISDWFIQEYCETQIIPEYFHLLAYTGSLYCMSYENLFFHTAKGVKGMLDYLGAGASADTINMMIREGSLEACRQKDQLYPAAKDKKYGQQAVRSHYRKGIAGDWKNCFSHKQACLVKQILGESEQKIQAKYFRKTQKRYYD